MAKFFMAVVHTFETIIGAVLLTIPGWQGVGFALLAMGLQGLYSDFDRPRSAGWRGDSQTVSLSSSEPRKGLVGQTSTAGSLVTWQTYDDNNKYLILIFALADHKCDSLVGGWWGGRRMTINPDGSVQEAFIDGSHNLWVTFYDGDWNQAADSELITQSGGRWTANDRGRGVCYVKVKAQYNEKAHPNGLAGLFQFLWEIKGAHLYDRRADSSVGGSGAQRFADQSTWAFTDNDAVVLENVLRGLRANTDVFFGLDLGDDDLPFAEQVAAFNACDEPVPFNGYGTGLTADALEPTATLSVSSVAGLSGGMTVRIDGGKATEERIVVSSLGAGPVINLAASTVYDHFKGATVDWAGTGQTEARYRAQGVISCDTTPRQAISDLLAAMAGKMLMTVDRWVIKPGVARTSIKTITDDDLALNGPYKLKNDTSLDGSLINSVYGRWADPTQQYSVVSLPPRLSSADEAEDGGRTSASYDLLFVASNTQGQRVLEIFRRQARRQKRPQIALLPLADNLGIEASDLLTWDSSRNGWTLDFEVEQAGIGLDDQQFLMRVLDLVETDSDVWGWDPATDQLDIDSPSNLSSADPTVTSVTGLVVTADSITSPTGEKIPALTFQIDSIVDPLCVAAHFQWRVHGTPSGAAQTHEQEFAVRPSENTAGSHLTFTVTEGVVSGAQYEARATEILRPEKPTAYTAWTLAAAATVSGSTPNRIFINARPASPLEGDINVVEDANGRVTGIESYHSGAWVQGSTNNKVTVSATAPASPTVNDIWVQLDANGRPTGFAYWSGTAWVSGGTRNVITASVSAPSSPTINDIWVQLDANSRVVSVNTWNGTAWVVGATKNTVTVSATAPSTPTVNDMWVQLDANGRVVGISYWTGTAWSAASTRNVITASATAPASPTVNDIWVVLDANGRITGFKTWNGTAWVQTSTNNNITTSGTAPSTPTIADVWVKTDANGRTVSISTWNGTAWVQSSTNNNISSGTSAPSTPTVNDVWVDTTTSGKPVVKIWNGSAWVASSIPVSVVQYLDATSGRLNNWISLPCVNYASGLGLVFDSFPFTSDTTHIFVAACSLTSESFTRSISSQTLSGLTAGTIYGIVYQLNSNFWGTCDPSSANAFITSVDLWLYAGQFATQASGGTYPTPLRPAGFTGDPNGRFNYSQP